MTISCVTCAVLRQLRPEQKPRIPTQPAVCDGDRAKLTGYLADIPQMFAAVPGHLEPGRVEGERRTSGFESRPPLNVAALSLLGDGSDTPRAVLTFWVQDWALTRDEHPAAVTVDELCLWLLPRLDWACNLSPAIDEFAADMRDVVFSLRPFQPRPTGHPAGKCPRKPGDVRCGGQLFADPFIDEITCERCGASWDRRQGGWTQLRSQQIAAGMEAA